jgi:hypothetical protein
MDIYLGGLEICHRNHTSIWQVRTPSTRCIAGYGNQNVSTRIRLFFLLILKDRLNTIALLRKRNMTLDSYTRNNCILQKEETTSHLFFLKLASPEDVGSCLELRPRTPRSHHNHVLVYLEMLKQLDLQKFQPMVIACKDMFVKEMTLTCYRIKPTLAEQIKQLMQHL